MKKTHNVVMLPTEKASKLAILKKIGEDPYLTDSILQNQKDINNGNGMFIYAYNLPIHQQLYIISDDEIKEGDWCLCIGADLDQAHPYHNAKIIQYTGKELGVSKIVATTNKSLTKICISCNGKGQHDKDGYNECKHCDTSGKICLSQIPESFILAYIKAYNEGKPITEVDLEMEVIFIGYFEGTKMENWDKVIKTRPDNTVIVHQSKTYSRDEVEKLIRKAVFRSPSEPVLNVLNFDKWIQDNL